MTRDVYKRQGNHTTIAEALGSLALEYGTAVYDDILARNAAFSSVSIPVSYTHLGTIAGGLVTEGKVHAKDKARVIRDGIVTVSYTHL